MTAGNNLGSKLVTEDIRRTLLGKSSAYNDVTFQTSDGETVAANRMLLAIRSDFFSALFYSGFAEQDAAKVKIDMRARVLQQVVEFAYTGSCHVVTKMTRFADEKRDIQEVRRSHFDDLVDLIRAADYCQMAPLKEACSTLLQTVSDLAPWTKCAVLQLRLTEPATVRFASRRKLQRDIAKDPRVSFLVPECVGRDKADDTNNYNEFGVLDLSGVTLVELVRASRDRDDFDNEYWFQVVYYWATDGQTLPRRSKQNTPELATSASGPKWPLARAMTQHLNLYSMRPLFVREYVEESGLVERDDVFKAYRFLATNDCEPLRPRKKRKTGWHVDSGAKPKWKDYSSSSEDSDDSMSSESSSSSEGEFW